MLLFFYLFEHICIAVCLLRRRCIYIRVSCEDVSMLFFYSPSKSNGTGRGTVRIIPCRTTITCLVFIIPAILRELGMTGLAFPKPYCMKPNHAGPRGRLQRRKHGGGIGSPAGDVFVHALHICWVEWCLL